MRQLECSGCGLCASDLPDGVDPELIFEVSEDGVRRCQGCEAQRGWFEREAW